MFVPSKSFQPSLMFVYKSKSLFAYFMCSTWVSSCFIHELMTYSAEWLERVSSGLYYKHVTIINYASSSVNQLRASLNDDTRVIIYDHQMFIVQATDANTLGPVISDEENSFIRLAPQTNFVKLFSLSLITWLFTAIID